MRSRKVSAYSGVVAPDGVQTEIVKLSYPFVGKIKVLAKYDKKSKQVIFNLVIDGTEYR